MNNPLYFEIQVDDAERAIDFYRNAFAWSFLKQEMTIDYWSIETTGIHGGLILRPAPAPPPRGGTNAAVLSMEVESFATTAEIILSNGGTEALPKFAVPGRCWQGYFVDTEGNTFGIFEVDSEAR